MLPPISQSKDVGPPAGLQNKMRGLAASGGTGDTRPVSNRYISGVLRRLLGVGVVAMALAGGVGWGWGPHPTITRAALEVLPERGRWERALGATNLALLAQFCLLPDLRGKDLGPFYADDYLLIRAMPAHSGHTMPTVMGTFEPYFRRALLALRTETPVNACRQMGPLLHFVEDAGAPPHAKEKCPHHKELENWVTSEEIKIDGYRPRVLGTDDDAALKGLLVRILGLISFSAERADRALPLVSAEEPDRARVEPIILESAIESARLTADVLHTVLTLGLGRPGHGAGLTGSVAAAELPGRNDHGARVVLLGTDYATLATTVGGVGWRGEYAFRNLSPGSYRVLVYRTASEFQIRGPIALKEGRTAALNFELEAAEPRGNIIENPDGRLAYLDPDIPDRWRQAGGNWMSTAAWIKPGAQYRCGALLKDTAARVSFRFEAQQKDGRIPPPQVAELELEGRNRGEVLVKAGSNKVSVMAVIESTLPLGKVVEKVWVVPDLASE